ncbi:MAG TPA: DUF502 domain-containing protein [Candidatus Polarisedimenticolia bacterium]|nr:DUF502 domain-containing protein [Candidatus Polarisedimenticolia bacterium]
MSRRRRHAQSPLLRLRQLFLTGLVIILPMVITIWLLEILFGMVNGISTPFILRLLALAHLAYVEDPAFTEYVAPLIGIVLTLLLIVMAGFLTTNLLGRRIVAAFDRLMLRIPLIKGIYGSARQLLDAFGSKTTSFQRVVAVEYPRPGVYTLGFVTRDQVALEPREGKRMSGYTFVFLPTTPNPTSGWLTAVPDGEVIPLDLTIEEGVKLIVSGGLVLPPSFTRRT